MKKSQHASDIQDVLLNRFFFINTDVEKILPTPPTVSNKNGDKSNGKIMVFQRSGVLHTCARQAHRIFKNSLGEGGRRP